MNYPASISEERKKELRRYKYELYKEGLIQFFHEQGYEEKYLEVFLRNSLKNMGFDEELKEDTLL